MMGINEWFATLPSASTILTPNRRLAATLTKLYHAYQQQLQRTVWPTLDILPYPNWLQRLWQAFTQQHFLDAPLLLTPMQELTLWEAIIQAAPHNASLLQFSKTAELAKSAYDTLLQWQVPLDHPELGQTEDGRVFQAWAHEFNQRCHTQNCLPQQALSDHLRQWLMTYTIALPSQLVVFGFTEINPQQEQLLQQCAALGSVIRTQESQSRHDPAPAYQLRAVDPTDELLTVAYAAKKYLTETTEPIRIACIIPNLESMRDQVVRIFNQVFNYNHQGDKEAPFNISAGKPLSSFAIIHAAFTFLHVASKSVSYDIVSRILLSPFLGEAEDEFTERAQFDNRLRRANIHKITITELLNRTARLNLWQRCPKLAKRLTTAQTILSDCSTEQSSSQWAHYFLALLNSLGWPGQRSINSHEYQVVQRWLDLLNEYRSLDQVLPAHDYATALHYLQQFTQKTIFQPQSSDAPIQILGLLEAAGLPFERIWVLGMDDTTWPAPAKPNPFIAHSLQKSLNMPHATAERELLYSKRLTEQLRLCTQTEIIFSYAEQNGELALRPSALIKDFPLIDLSITPLPNSSEIIFNHRQVEYLHDHQAPHLATDTMLAGGSAILKHQAACPFKAFAELRLQAVPLETPAPGLRYQDRGSIIHRALEIIWRQLIDSSTLQMIADEPLKQIITDAVDAAILKITGNACATQRYLQLESQRLQNLLWNWLALEKQRPPFKVIALEYECNTTIGMLPLQLRIDRIDQLADGSYIIIDYKTGKQNSLHAWFGERLDEPQLPLYCIAHPQQIVALVIAEVNTERLGFKGISEQQLAIDAIIPIHELSEMTGTLDPQWSDQLNQWRTVLEHIAEEFQQGHAAVQPKDRAQTCRHCHTKPLCRIYEEVERT